MKKKTIIYLSWTLVIANLLYNESWGLNALIISVLAVMLHGTEQLTNLTKGKWWLAAGILILNGFAVFQNGTLLSIGLFFIAYLFFLAIHHSTKSSLILGGFTSLFSAVSGFYYAFETLIRKLSKREEKRNNKTLIKTLLIAVPLLIGIVFLKLYQNADPTFYAYTKFINLEWISWGFILFYGFLLLFCYGLYYYRNSATAEEWEETLSNDIDGDYTDAAQRYIGEENEKKGAIGLIIMLNVLLLLYNFIDVKFLFFDMPIHNNPVKYSDLLHNGVYSLITSVVFVILIITYIYRGKINFIPSKSLKLLTYVWLIQNLIMISTTVFKNVAYISNWGLTYKRIGVYTYLILAGIGILFTFYKVITKQSIWFLIRTNSIAFLICFSILSTINWNKVITNYNLTKIELHKIDYDYLLSLGKDAYPGLIEHTAKYENENNYAVRIELEENTKLYLTELQLDYNNYSWRSLIYNDYVLMLKLAELTTKQGETHQQAKE